MERNASYCTPTWMVFPSPISSAIIARPSFLRTNSTPCFWKGARCFRIDSGTCNDRAEQLHQDARSTQNSNISTKLVAINSQKTVVKCSNVATEHMQTLMRISQHELTANNKEEGCLHVHVGAATRRQEPVWERRGGHNILSNARRLEECPSCSHDMPYLRCAIIDKTK